jgi:phosphoribosylanthranilate isomerase
MWIKICANTNLDDAQLAAGLGADAVGFVFAPSARRVTAAEVARITPYLPDKVERIGVVHSHDVDEIAGIVHEAELTGVQLHGGVDPALARRLREIFKGRLTIIQTVHWLVDGDGANADEVARQLREIGSAGVVDRVLIDSKVGAAIGGTGVAFDWDAARGVLAEASRGLKVIVAGGLRPENVAEAVRGLSPWGVDVASGVEAVPGRKDAKKLAAFIRSARGKAAVRGAS